MKQHTRMRSLSHGEMMTRRDFVAVATSLAAIEDETRRREEIARWINILRASNPRFDSSRSSRTSRAS